MTCRKVDNTDILLKKTLVYVWFLVFVTLFLHVFVQTEAVSIHFEHFAANRGHFYSNFGQ